MNVQTIMRDGVPEYAVLPWAEYQALLNAAGLGEASAGKQAPPPKRFKLSELPALREKKGMSREVLARTAGISPVYLDLIEKGERDPGEVIGRSLARALEIDGWEPLA